MKRLTVRLSIVAAVLVLGGATIAHSVLTKRAATPASESTADPPSVAEHDAMRTPVPIQAPDADYGVPTVSLQPPPSSAFTRPSPLKSVSHETAVQPEKPVSAVAPDPAMSEPFVPPTDETADSASSTYAEYDPTEPTDSAAVSTAPPSTDASAALSGTGFPLTGAPAASSEVDQTASSGETAKSLTPSAASRSLTPEPSMPPWSADPIRGSGDAGLTSPAAQLPAATATTLASALPTAAPPASAANSTAAPAAGVPLSALNDRSGQPTFPGVQPAEYPSTGREMGVQVPASAPPTSSGKTIAPASDFTSDVPGDRQLEGPQSPAVVIEKTAPDEIQVAQPATFQLVVRNVGNAPAYGVVVTDQIPRGTEFVSAVPECTRTPDGRLIWDLQTLEANEEATLALELLPKLAGEIGSVAQVSFQAQASVRTVCTQPQLTLELTAPEQVLIGTAATLDIIVTNTGTGAATNVVIEEDVPEGFTHAAGRQLEHEIGTLRPQESRRLSLVLAAAQAGVYQNRLVVHGAGNLLEEDVRSIEIAAPQLQVSMEGPALRYLDRQATYVIRMGNPGTAPARNIELVAHLPKGMQYVTADNHGQYDSQAHAVYWNLEELPAARQGDVHLTVLPVELGNHRLKAEGRGEAGLQHACEHEVVVEGLAGLTFSVTDVADPIEVGSDTTYEIRVENRGSKADSDIRVVVEMPPGMLAKGGDGPGAASVQGQFVSFDPVPRLAPGEGAVYKIVATGQQTGDHVIRVRVQSAELRVPVTKEEITRVYTDR